MQVLKNRTPLDFRTIWAKFGTIGIFLILIIFFGVLAPRYFLQVNNIVQILLQSAIIIILACGEFFAILIAGIDLSIGSILGLSGMMSAKLMASGMTFIPAILLGGLLFGALLGSFNGLLVSKTGLHPFIITLGTQSIFRGFTLVISDARPVYNFPIEFKTLINGNVLGLPAAVIIAVVLTVILAFMLKFSVLGRSIYAMGGNSEAARFAGINLNMIRMVVFTISGFCAGIAGVVMNARLGAAEPLAGVGYETRAIAAVIIGGASFFGGKGKIMGALFGGLIIGVISNGLNILNVSSYYQQIVMGSLIIFSVILDRLLSKQKIS